MQPIKDNQAKKLSGGQKRKLSIGIAILGDPKVNSKITEILVVILYQLQATYKLNYNSIEQIRRVGNNKILLAQAGLQQQQSP